LTITNSKSREHRNTSNQSNITRSMRKCHKIRDMFLCSNPYNLLWLAAPHGLSLDINLTMAQPEVMIPTTSSTSEAICVLFVRPGLAFCRAEGESGRGEMNDHTNQSRQSRYRPEETHGMWTHVGIKEDLAQRIAMCTDRSWGAWIHTWTHPRIWDVLGLDWEQKFRWVHQRISPVLPARDGGGFCRWWRSRALGKEEGADRRCWDRGGAWLAAVIGGQDCQRPRISPVLEAMLRSRTGMAEPCTKCVDAYTNVLRSSRDCPRMRGALWLISTIVPSVRWHGVC
jgi:hypothetical protein